MKPTLTHEKRLWMQGYRHIAGIDEVGRGALAGPVVVSAVIFPKKLPKNPTLLEVRDSKRLKAKKREELDPIIKSAALDWAYGQSTVAEINRHGIMNATQIAMRRAIKALRAVEFVLVDAFYIPYVKGLPRPKQLAIKKGDECCFSIAAASILAKVHRDAMMTRLGNRHPEYELGHHKGYGTPAHRQAIRIYGAKHFHRKIFIRNCL